MVEGAAAFLARLGSRDQYATRGLAGKSKFGMTSADATQTTFSNTVETHLTAKPRAAAQGLQQIIEKRRQRLAGLERELDNIQTTDA